MASVGDDDLALSVVVIGEIRRGIEQVRRRDARRAGALEHWLAQLLANHEDSVLPVDRAVAEEWGRLTAVRSGSLVDLLMAATARVHGLTLVTRNVRDIEWTGVPYLNPFDGRRDRVS
jgi:predicted nucleic acid-binding protein